MQNGIMSFSMANFIAILGMGGTVILLLIKLVWQASAAVTEIKRIGGIVDKHDPLIDDHEHRITKLESTSPAHFHG